MATPNKAAACMLRKTCLLLVLMLIFCTTHAQTIVKGIVLNEKLQPAIDASIFLNNTSIGTKANSEGKFELAIPPGRYELVISFVGYQTQTIDVNAATELPTLNIKLLPKTNELEMVVIEPYEKDGWQKWGNWFTENFIGTSEHAANCRLKNKEVLRFRFRKNSNRLTITALEPLVIENRALGYNLIYQLESFSYDLTSRYLLYTGYPFFQPMQGNDRKQRKWEQTRNEVYEGSLLHFMRSLYRNKINEAGFEIRRLQKIPNAEKARVRQLYQSRLGSAGGNTFTIGGSNSDSSAYYSTVLKQSDITTIVGRALLPGDSIAYAIDSLTAGLFFEDHLLISYPAKTVPAAYKRMYPKSGDALTSELTLTNQRPVAVLANGSFFSPTDLLTSGYWAWWEKMSTMLPFDFKPDQKRASR